MVMMDVPEWNNRRWWDLDKNRNPAVEHHLAAAGRYGHQRCRETGMMLFLRDGGFRSSASRDGNHGNGNDRNS